jgi:hypothetical protein
MHPVGNLEVLPIRDRARDFFRHGGDRFGKYGRDHGDHESAKSFSFHLRVHGLLDYLSWVGQDKKECARVRVGKTADRQREGLPTSFRQVLQTVGEFKTNPKAAVVVREQRPYKIARQTIPAG